MSSSEVEALDRLERLVKTASESIDSLRSENAELRDKLSALETAAAESSEWAAEKEQLAQRVGSLADGLEKLIERTQD